MIRLIVVLIVALGMSGAVWAAKKESKKDDKPLPPTITVYLDVDLGGRTKGAARKLTEMHTQYHQRGYELLDVDLYVEDGDLEGFFVTYRQK